MTLLSVVVPVYDVGSYLAPCLDSVLASSLNDLEVVCVDDGSTDGSADVLDRYAAADPRVRVLHVPNGGPGRARNLGVQHAQGTYVTFVDADDRVPVDGLRLLCASLERTGSQLATGRVRRFSDTRSWLSELHVRATPQQRQGTTLAESPSLLYDYTVSNKVLRRSLWDAAGLAFPEGVFYEDMILTTRAYLAATSVDVLTSTVYEWRHRGGDVLSTTQRGAEAANLRARLDAIDTVRSLLVDGGHPELVADLERKEVSLDLPLYLHHLPEMADEARRLFAERTATTLAQAPPDALAALPVTTRVPLELVRRGHVERAAQLVVQRRERGGDFDVVRRGRRLLADLPGLGDPSTGVPESAYDVRAELGVSTEVSSVVLDTSGLRITGHAEIDKVPLRHRWSARRSLQLRAQGTPREISRPLRHADGDLSAFEVVVPLDRLRPAAGPDTVYEAHITVRDLTGRHRGPLTGSHGAAATLVPPLVTDDGRYLSVTTAAGGAVRVAVRRDVPLLESARFTPDGLVCELLLPSDFAPGSTLTWRAGDDAAPLSAPLEPSAGAVRRAVATVALPEVDDAPAPGTTTWRATVDAGSRRRAVVCAPGLAETEYASGPQELAVRLGPGGRTLLQLRDAAVVVRAVSWRGGDLQIEATWTTAEPLDARDVVLRFTDGRELAASSVTQSGAALRATFTVLDAELDVSIAPGRWRLAAWRRSGSVRLPVAVEVDRSAGAAMELSTGSPTARAVTEAGPRGLDVVVTEAAARAATVPTDGGVVLVNGAVTSVSPDLVALHAALGRRGLLDSTTWVRRDTGTPAPRGGASLTATDGRLAAVLRSARIVIADDAGDDLLAAASPERVVRLGAGSQLLARCGAPRLDLLRHREATEGTAGARQRLGLRTDQRVVLWAPALRPDHRDLVGRPVLRLPFDSTAADTLIGPDDVLLLRADPSLAPTAAGAWQGDPAIRNVTTYPDVQDLLLAADVLVTDYSDLATDFAVLARPVIVFAWDADSQPELAERHLSSPVGPVVTTLDGLRTRLRTIDTWFSPSARNSPATGHADGDASERVLDEVL